jgi:hypothetical protein
MTRPSARSLFLVLLCAAGAAHAGTVYVPLPGVSQAGTATYEAQAVISNGAAQQTDVQEVLLVNDTDGTRRTGTPAQLQVPAGRSIVVRPGAAFRGLMELTGATHLRYSARLAGLGTAGALGVYLPVLTSENMAVAGRLLALHGLVAAGTRSTDLAVVNLGHQAAQCTINLTRADGTAIISPATITVQPLSQRYFGNAFNGLVDPAVGVAEARATVSCNRQFYAYALLANSATGELAFVGPAGSGESTLQIPGAPTTGGCPTGATCFAAAGLLHRPTPATPVARVSFDAPAGTYSRLRLSLDVTVGNWYAADPDGKHLIYWFVINRNFDMPGMLFFRGPNANIALVRHGIGLRHAEKFRVEQPFQGVPGRTYRCVNDYDMGRGTYTVTITDLASGLVVATLTDVPNVRQFTLKAGDKFLIDMGFPEGRTPDEVPSFNWSYSDARLEVYP